jgi:hypothetical protein
MRVVENNKMNLALKENLKWSTVCDEIEEIDLKGSNHEHEIGKKLRRERATQVYVYNE